MNPYENVILNPARDGFPPFGPAACTAPHHEARTVLRGEVLPIQVLSPAKQHW